MVKKISEWLRNGVLIGIAVMVVCVHSGNAAENERVQEDNCFQLDTITVMATRTPKAPLDSPAGVSVITEDEIDAFHSAHPFKPLALTDMTMNPRPVRIRYTRAMTNTMWSMPS